MQRFSFLVDFSLYYGEGICYITIGFNLTPIRMPAKRFYSIEIKRLAEIFGKAENFSCSKRSFWRIFC